MCLALSMRNRDHYFGRNLDYDKGYGQQVVITPRHHPFEFRHAGATDSHAAIIGTAAIVNGHPLYFEGANEDGLCIAGLLFSGSSRYNPPSGKKGDVASHEFIPWVLTQCSDTSEFLSIAEDLNITNEAFSVQLPPSPMHWMVSDKKRDLVVEQVSSGLNIHENPTCVLTNNPPFEYQMMNLNNYMGLSSGDVVNSFSKKINLWNYSRGMGALGLPGDLSSQSRFVKAAFTASNSICNDSEEDSVTQFMHILKSAEQQKGCVRIGEGYEITQYSSCINADRGRMYFTTYGNSRISVVDMNKEDLDSDDPISFPMDDRQDFDELNACVKCGHGRRSPSCRP